jgi:hypothetical protein
MQHFSVVQTLCRFGLDGNTPQVRRQVERLRDRLRKEGEQMDAAVLDRLLVAAERETALAPSRVEVSRALVRGEVLAEGILPPADRETGAVLAEVILRPGESLPSPIYPPQLQAVLDGLIDEWKRFEQLEALGVAPSRSCLIYGPPGTGKTLTAMSMAQRLSLPVVLARIDGLVSSFLGTTARNIANLFAFANRYRCVLLLDEFDALAKMRDDPHEIGEIKRLVNTLLQNLDARAGNGITIAITNHERLLDPAVWRRFEVQIKMPLPAEGERVRLAETFLFPVPVDADVVAIVAHATEGASGADLKMLVDAAKRKLALGNVELTPRTVCDAFRAALARSAMAASPKARLLIEDPPEDYIAQYANEDGYSVTQAGLAKLFGVSQATISRWTKKRVLEETDDHA